MRADCLMIQGLASGVGKSVLVAGLCRLLARRGVKVAPFKPQNMSNNAAVAEGGEIARAQALQALACGIVPDVRMNPVLLKPEGDRVAECIVLGRVRGQLHARRFCEDRAALLAIVREAFFSLCEQHDFVLVEGAGSPAEPNLMRGDIANMGFAEAVDAPVWLLGDIDRGGVFAHFLGTLAVLGKQARRVQALVINKFRGERALLAEALDWLEEQTNKPIAGVIPWLSLALPEEDAPYRLMQAPKENDARFCVAVVLYPRASNLDDLDPLAADAAIRLVGARRPEDLAAADLVVLPGSKQVAADFRWLQASGLADAIKAHHRRGGFVLGICGGMQMLGRQLKDPLGKEGGSFAGLGLLPIATTIAEEKVVRRVEAVARYPAPLPVAGYEIHYGRSSEDAASFPFAAISDDGRVFGTYLHGLLHKGAFRAAWLGALGLADADATDHEARVLAELDRLADVLQAHLDLSLLGVAGKR